MQQRTNAFTQTAVDTFVSIDQRIIEAFFVWCHSDAGGHAATGTGSAAAAVGFVAQGEHIVVERAEFLFEGTLFPGYFRLPGLIFFA